MVFVILQIRPNPIINQICLAKIIFKCSQDTIPTVPIMFILIVYLLLIISIAAGGIGGAGDMAVSIYDAQLISTWCAELSSSPWIFPGGPLTFIGAPGNIQANLDSSSCGVWLEPLLGNVSLAIPWLWKMYTGQPSRSHGIVDAM